MFFEKVSQLIFAILNTLSPRDLAARVVDYLPDQVASREQAIDEGATQTTKSSVSNRSNPPSIAVESLPSPRSYVPILKRGITAPAVEDIQIFLTEQGYYSGSIDGVYGSRTVEAVRAFQKDNNLLEDGIVGYQTWEAIIELCDWI